LNVSGFLNCAKDIEAFEAYRESMRDKHSDSDDDSNEYMDIRKIPKEFYKEWWQERCKDERFANAAKNNYDAKKVEVLQDSEDEEEVTEEEIVEVSPKRRGRPRKAVLQDSEEEEEEIVEVSPKRRGRPPKAVQQDSEEEEAVPGKDIQEVSPKKRGRPPKAGHSVSASRTGKSTKEVEMNESDDDSNNYATKQGDKRYIRNVHEYDEDTKTFGSARVSYSSNLMPVSYSSNLMAVKREEPKEVNLHNEHAVVSRTNKMDTQDERRAKIKARFLEKPPQFNTHPETFTLYVSELPDSDCFVVIAALLNNKTKQPSVFLRTGFLLEALQVIADLDTHSIAVQQYRDALANCQKVTFRKMEHGDNECQYHEYQKTTYFHEGVLLLPKKDFKRHEAVQRFELSMKEILRSDMFFIAIQELLQCVGQTGVSIEAMKDEKSPVWRYLKNPSTMTVVVMKYLDQMLLDDDIINVLKTVYGDDWKKYTFVGWKNNNKYTFFNKRASF